jgi:hypothetical protein
MLCSETDSRMPAVKIGMPLDLARDFSYILKSIIDMGGNGRITFEVHGGNVTSTEVTVKRQRKKAS